MDERFVDILTWALLVWYWCASSLQNLAVPHDFYRSFSLSVELSCWPCFHLCGTGGLWSQWFLALLAPSFILRKISSSLHFCCLFFSLSLLLSLGWYSRADESIDWWGVNRSLTVLHCRALLIIILLLLKPPAEAQVRETKCLLIAFATPQEPAPQKTEITQFGKQQMVDGTL